MGNLYGQMNPPSRKASEDEHEPEITFPRC
jgi:hypothetical protein